MGVAYPADGLNVLSQIAYVRAGLASRGSLLGDRHTSTLALQVISIIGGGRLRVCDEAHSTFVTIENGPGSFSVPRIRDMVQSGSAWSKDSDMEQ